MKTTLLPLLVFLAAGQLKTYSGNAQANNTLSNLATTAINTDLLPDADYKRSLGSPARGWKQLYVDNLIYLGGARYISYGSSISFQNTGVGSFAMAGTTSGTNNTALGAYALRNNTTGYNNVAVGFTSLFKSVAGHNNVAVGAASLYNNSTGVSNAAFGNNALLSNTTGSNNMAIGANALYYNSTGNGNVGIGIRALFNNKGGSGLVAIGDSAMFTAAGTTYYNVAIGSRALYANVTGSGNTAVGNSAATKTTGGGTTAVGSSALLNNTSGASNTAVGALALDQNSTGNFNTTVGAYSLSYLYSGSGNTAIGNNTLNVPSGDDNTGLGANTSVFNGMATNNSTAVGANALIRASNQVSLGNALVTSVVASDDVTLVSDGRYKTGIKEDVPGIDFIRVLRPVTYHYDVHALYALEQSARHRNVAPGSEAEKAAVSEALKPWQQAAIATKEKKLHSGFVAQEVEAAAKKINYEFSGLYTPQNENDIYGLSYSDFVVPLVKATQQLIDSNAAKKVKIDSLTAGMDSLTHTIDRLSARLEKLETMTHVPANSGVALTDASLGQNTPNPVSESTVIAYTLPRSYGRARIQITDMNGRIVKTIPVTGSGNGTLKINTAALSAGSYPYVLYVDGAVVGTKQMLVVR